MEPTLKKAVSGDTEALSELLRLHGPAVQKRLHISPQWRAALEPEDVMQVTYLEAFLHITAFDPERGTPFQAWLEHIAQNNLRDAIRGLSRQKQPQPAQRIREPARSSMDSYVGLLESLGTSSATPSRHAAANEARTLIDRALETMPEDYAAVIRLYDLAGKDIGQVMEHLGRSSGAVHMLRARAHDCLKQVLGTESMFFSSPP